LSHKKRNSDSNAQAFPVPEAETPASPTVPKGNYIIQIISEGQEIKRIAVAGAEINITKLAEGGLAIDLK